jgi:hypothetical protein
MKKIKEGTGYVMFEGSAQDFVLWLWRYNCEKVAITCECTGTIEERSALHAASSVALQVAVMSADHVIVIVNKDTTGAVVVPG